MNERMLSWPGRRLSEEDEKASTAEADRFAEHLGQGNGPDAALTSVYETLMPGGAVLVNEGSRAGRRPPFRAEIPRVAHVLHCGTQHASRAPGPSAMFWRFLS